jgi:hypothetical protein
MTKSATNQATASATQSCFADDAGGRNITSTDFGRLISAHTLSGASQPWASYIFWGLIFADAVDTAGFGDSTGKTLSRCDKWVYPTDGRRKRQIITNRFAIGFRSLVSCAKAYGYWRDLFLAGGSTADTVAGAGSVLACVPRQPKQSKSIWELR